VGTHRSTSKLAQSVASLPLGVFSLLFLCRVDAAVLQVGPTRAYKMPSEAAVIARSGDTVEIDAGVYDGDVAVWRQNRLSIRGVGGLAHIKADGNAAEDKGIWVVKGSDVTVEHIEFSGARVPDKNGAGIRQEGMNLTVRHCFFHDNENGILGGAGTVLVEYSEFARNGFGDGQSHNMYVSGRTQRFELRGSYSHGAKVGHNVKSRARENWILYNRITDDPGGNPSYSIDLPNGGIAYIIGNIIEQGRHPENNTLLSYGAEGVPTGDAGAVYVVNNTFVNEFESGVFIANAAPNVVVQIVNNLFAGAGTVATGRAEKRANWHGIDPGFKSVVGRDYRLRRYAAAIDKGIDPGTVHGFELAPKEEYVHLLKLRPRPRTGRLDLGAYEFADAGSQ
jgi:hypothetical protein